MRRKEPEKISSRAPKVAQQKPAAVDDALREQKDNAKAVPHEEQQDIVAEALSDNEVKCRVMSSNMRSAAWRYGPFVLVFLQAPPQAGPPCIGNPVAAAA